MGGILGTLREVAGHLFRRRETVLYPEVRPALPPRWRGRIVLTRDPDGAERCVACFLCAVACPVGCIAIEAADVPGGRRGASSFRINFSRCIFCGLCEEACPTAAIQLTPDCEMGEYDRRELVYEKDDLLIAGPGKRPGYRFYGVAGAPAAGKAPGDAEHEAAPVDPHGLLP
ncbi:MAG TPA: NADH-quinone oxidoreductase subunit NuoI [bacterium]